MSFRPGSLLVVALFWHDHALSTSQPGLQCAQLRDCRWDITRLNSKKTCVYKPSPLDGESGSRDNLKKVVLGAVFNGDYQKLPRGNKKVGLTWEASYLVI